MDRLTKSFPVFDCDAHINDPDADLERLRRPEYREDLVRQTYWKDDDQAILNGRTPVIGGGAYDFPGYNPICIAGPQMNKKIMRKLQQIGAHAGAEEVRRAPRRVRSARRASARWTSWGSTR